MLVPIEGEAQVAPYREVQEKKDLLGKKVPSRKEKWRRSRRSLPEGLGQSEERTSKRKRNLRENNLGDGEHPQSEMAEGAPEETPAYLIRPLNPMVRILAAGAMPIKRPDAPTWQEETETEGRPDSEGPQRGDISQLKSRP